MVGECVVSVPPFVMWSRMVFWADMQVGRIVRISMGMLPAVPISASYLPPLIVWGLNQISREPSVAPFSSALHSFAAVKTASRCWGFSPRCGLFCLML